MLLSLRQVTCWMPPSLIALLLVGCGFHLRGMTPSDNTSGLKRIALVFNKQDYAFSHALQQAASNASIAVAPDADWQITIIRIDTEKLRVTSSVTAERDRFSLRYRVQYTLTHQQEDHHETFGPLTVDKQASFQNNERQVISKYNEETQIIDELRTKAANTLIRRAALIASHPPACETHHETQATTTR